MPPLPKPRRHRHGAPTIPTTFLPASGRRGPAPRVPAGFALGDAGRRWWRWAWKLPQACGWGDGVLYTVARRAQLEELWAETRLTGWAREMRELDDRLGLTPRGRANLRWEIVDDQFDPGPGPEGEPASVAKGDEITRRRTDRERRLVRDRGSATNHNEEVTGDG